MRFLLLMFFLIFALGQLHCGECNLAMVEYVEVGKDPQTKATVNLAFGCAVLSDKGVALIQIFQDGKPKVAQLIAKENVVNITPLSIVKEEEVEETPKKEKVLRKGD